MSWTNDVVLEFLDHYRIEQVLWDPKHLSHKNRNEVNDAWLRIQNSMSIKCSIMDLKKKKESLMTAFRLHIKRKKKNPRYQTCWFAFSAMENFLGEKYEYDSTNHSDHEVKGVKIFVQYLKINESIYKTPKVYELHIITYLFTSREKFSLPK